MAGSLAGAAVPEESIGGSTAAHAPRSIGKLIHLLAISGSKIRSTLVSGHSGSTYSIDSASNSFPFNNDGCSSGSARAAPTGAMARQAYRYLIRRVAVSGSQIRHTLSAHSQSGHSGSSYSSDSALNSGCSSGSALSAATADSGTNELKTIAGQMVSDGYTQRMVQAFEYGGDPGRALEDQFLELHIAPPAQAFDGPDHVLESWFLELDVAWVVQIRLEHGSEWQLRLQDNSGSSLQDLVERWIRGLTVTVYSVVELLSIRHEMTSVARFAKASILKMLVFVDAIAPAFKAENLRSVLDIYIYVRKAMDIMGNSEVSPELVDLSLTPTLSVYVDMLKRAISNTMEKVRTLIEDDDSWAIEIPRGGGQVHMNTRWIADCIVSLYEADAGSAFLPINFSGILSDMILYPKELLRKKSELSRDASLRYLFLLNNSYFVAQMIEQCEPGHDWKRLLDCEHYMYSYLDVSWEHVLSCIPKSRSSGLLHRWINTSSLGKFESAFNKTYQAQKFWKVPDPQLRDILRRTIAERVVSSYRDYLKEYPELAEHVSRGNNTPNVLEEMLGELFEG